MEEILVYVGTAYKKMGKPIKGSLSLFATGILVITGQETLPDISVALSKERILSRVKLRALLDTLGGLADSIAGKRVTGYVNDDYIEYTYSSGQIMNELEDMDNGKFHSVKDIDLWRPLVATVRKSNCRFQLASGALLLGMCNEAASVYLRKIAV